MRSILTAFVHRLIYNLLIRINDAYTPCLLDIKMCVYTEHSNRSHHYTVQVIVELKYMIVVIDIVVEIYYRTNVPSL